MANTNNDINSVFIGNKPFMKYVTAVILKLNKGDVVIKARGKWITRAVDVAEVIKNDFIKDTEVTDVKIGSEEIKINENKKKRLSTIDLILSKKDK